MLLGTLGVSLIENLLDGNWINLDEYKLLQDNWIALNGNVNDVIPFDSFGIEYISKET